MLLADNRSLGHVRVIDENVTHMSGTFVIYVPGLYTHQGAGNFILPTRYPGSQPKTEATLRRVFLEEFAFSYLSEKILIEGIADVGSRCDEFVKNGFRFWDDPPILRLFEYL